MPIPYLATAAVLAAVHHGLVNKLKPTDKQSGNRSEAVDDTIPFTLWSALDNMEGGEIIRDYFTSRYVDAYVAVKRAEFEAFISGLLPREFEWYL